MVHVVGVFIAANLVGCCAKNSLRFATDSRLESVLTRMLANSRMRCVVLRVPIGPKKTKTPTGSAIGSRFRRTVRVGLNPSTSRKRHRRSSSSSRRRPLVVVVVVSSS